MPRVQALAGRVLRAFPWAHRRARRLIHRSPAVRGVLRRLGFVTPAFRPRGFLLRMLPPASVGAEIGVHVGDFSAEILRVVRPARLHLIDPWKHETAAGYHDMGYGGQLRFGQAEMDDRYEGVLTRFRRRRGRGQVVVHRCASADVSAEFPDDYFDWVYVDGNHFYEYVKQDLELYFPKVKAGGYLMGDDYTEGWWQDGVRLAVGEFLNNRPVAVVALQDDQFILRKRS